MKLRYSSVVSVLPAHDIFWKNPCRFSFNLFCSNLSRRRRIPLSSIVSQKRQVSAKAGMGAEQYLPPWFRWALICVCVCVCLIYLLLAMSLLILWTFWVDYWWCFSSVAPMMDWTDHHYRTLARLISKHAWLYTEMLAAETIVYQQHNLVS